MNLFELWNSLNLSNTEAILICVTALVAGTARGFSGFGSAMIMAPIYVSIFGPVMAVPVVLALEALISLPLLTSSVKTAQYDTVFRMLITAVIGAVLGMGVVAFFPADTLATLVAGIVLVFVALMAVQKPQSGKVLAVSNHLKYIAGGASGLFGSISGMTGPPAVMLMLKSNASPLTIRATLIIYFMLIDVLLVAGYSLWEGAFHLEWLGLVGLSLPPMVVGSWIGGFLFQFASAHLFRILTLSLVAVAALIGLLT